MTKENAILVGIAFDNRETGRDALAPAAKLTRAPRRERNAGASGADIF